MERRHMKIIGEHTEVIVRTLNLSCLLPYLKDKRLVTDKQFEQLRQQSHTTNLDRNEEFLQILKSKGSKAFSLFVEALTEEEDHLGHEDLARILSEADTCAPDTAAMVTTICSTRSNQISSAIKIKGNSQNLMYSVTPEQAWHTPQASPSRLPQLMLESNESGSESMGSNHSDSSQDQSASVSMPGTFPRCIEDITTATVFGQQSVQQLLKSQFDHFTKITSEKFNKFQEDVNQRFKILENKVESQSLSQPVPPLSRPLSRSSTATGSLSSHSAESSMFYDIEYAEDDSRPKSSRYPSSSRSRLNISDQTQEESAHKKQMTHLPRIKQSKTPTKSGGIRSSKSYDTLPGLRQEEKPSSVIEVPCTCQLHHSLLLPLIQQDQVNFVLTAQQATTEPIPGHVEGYSLSNGQRFIQDEKTFTNCPKSICPVILPYLNKLTVLANDADLQAKNPKLMLYQLNKIPWSAAFSWELLFFKCFNMHFEPKNTISAIFGNEEIIVVSLVIKQNCSRIEFQLLSPRKSVAGKYNKMAYLHLGTSDRRYQIQSCIIISKYIYCSVLLPGTRLTIYKVDLTPLQYTKEKNEGFLINSQMNWIYKDASLKSCYLAVLKKDIPVSIVFYEGGNRSTVEVKQLQDHTSTSSSVLVHKHEFPQVIKAVTATFTPSIPNTLIIIYHSDLTNKCYLCKLSID